MSTRALAGLLALCLVSGGAGFALYRALGPAEVAPALVLPGLDGQPQDLAQWRGKLLLVNFWATWCAPCIQEIPLLVQAQAEYGAQGLQVIGPAMDSAEPVQALAARLNINYPLMVGDTAVAQAMTALGDTLGALPYSVLISPTGEILLRRYGEFSKMDLDQLLRKHLPVTS